MRPLNLPIRDGVFYDIYYLFMIFHTNLKVLYCTVYIPDKTVAKAGSQELSSIIHELEVDSPDAFIVINGDFNHGSLKRPGSSYYQHVDCPTRGEATLDLCYSNVRDAYTATQLPNLGAADHDLVLLLPKYRPIVQRLKPRVINVKQWSPEVDDRLQDCFNNTDWSVFIDSSSDIDELTETVSSYIKFCEDLIVPSKKVKCYSNNKPWITKDVKQIINQKKDAYRRGDKTELKEIQKELNIAIKTEKTRYKQKIEQCFIDNNMKQVWQGMRLMSGNTTNSNSGSKMPDQSMDYANQLNDFYNRFDRHDFSNTIECMFAQLPAEPVPFLAITDSMVRDQFAKVNPAKAAGPDMLSPRVLKSCSRELADIFTYIFNLSFSTQSIPTIWKHSCIIPVPKKPTISCMNDLRPVALTSAVMKICERFVLDHLRSLTSGILDPLQFAYAKGRSTEDAVLFMLDKLYSHLENTRASVSARIMYFDFSSAFNTIQPHLLADKLAQIHTIPHSMIRWILQYLTNRSQFVKLSNGNTSEVIASNTGVPQGTVLAPFLFTVYTYDIRSTSPHCSVVKFADDTALIGLVENDVDSMFVDQVNRFVEYCELNYLELNVSKTKEMIIDFRTKYRNSFAPLTIKGTAVERVSEYKYLGVVIDDELSWTGHIQNIEQRLRPRMYCLRKLNHFNVSPEILAMFYNAVICSVWTYCMICWVGNTDKTKLKIIDDIIRKAGRIITGTFPTVSSVYESRVRQKLESLWSDQNHPLYNVLISHRIPRSGRLRSVVSNTNRYRNSFMGCAIRLFNLEFQR